MHVSRSQEEGNQSAGSRRGFRTAQRGYELQNACEFERDWNYEPKEFYSSRSQQQPNDNSRQKLSTRSSNFKKKVEDAKVKKSGVKPTLRASTEETPPLNEPMYDMGPHSTMIAMQDVHCQNFDFCGFISIVTESYENLRGIDLRLMERLPFSMYRHALCVHLNLQIGEVARQGRQRVLDQTNDFRELLPDYQCIPECISDYLAHVTTVITPKGTEVRLNLPGIAIPQGPIVDEEGGELIPSGSFGPVDDNTHKVYECYFSPYITSRRVEASRDNEARYHPLPVGTFPEGTVPNQNLLGYGPIDVQNLGAQQRLQGIVFPDDDSQVGRFRICETLQSRVYTILAEMKDRYAMCEYHRTENKEGLNKLDKVIPNIIAANLAFVEKDGPFADGANNDPLRTRTVNEMSYTTQGLATTNQANIEIMHHRQSGVRGHVARGCCYTQNRATIPGWEATMNSNFEMIAPFEPVIHFDYPALGEAAFSLRVPAGSRINSFLKRNYQKDKR